MAELNGTITGNAPFSFVVRKVGETTGNRCTGSCSSFPIEFTHDSGNHQYYFIVTDADECVVDSRNIPNGTGTVNCDVVQPNFDYEFTQPVCLEGDVYQAGVIHLTNITNATRYKICYNTTTMDCGDCTVSTGTISGSSINITVDTPTVPTSRGVFLRVYNGVDCVAYRDHFETMITPNCVAPDAPDFDAQILQPYCSSEFGGTPQNATLRLTNIINSSRYKICYNSTVFSAECNSNCTSSDGVISGTAKDIEITSPSEGITQDNVIRVYNGSGCSNYIDFPFKVRTPKCSVDEISYATISFQVFSYIATCDDVSTYPTRYDMYLTPNTIGLESINGVKSKIGNTSERNLPNGNDVPNVYISAGFKESCVFSTNPSTPTKVESIFYRFAINLALLKANFPSVNTFTFDAFALRTKTSGVQDENIIRVRRNTIPGVRMINQLHANNSLDAFRDPPYIGETFTEDTIYNTAISGVRKIGTLSFNYTTNLLTWVPL